jgi:hypothetical protein
MQICRRKRLISSRVLPNNRCLLREEKLHFPRIREFLFVQSDNIFVILKLEIFEKAIDVVKPKLSKSVKGSDKCARRGIRHGPRLHIATYGFLDDGLARK